MGFSLKSGTDTAILYDSLLADQRVDDYQRLEGKRRAVGLYTVATSALLGGFLYSINHNLPLYATILTSLCGIAISLGLIEPKRIKSAIEHNAIVDMLKTMKYALHGHKEVAGIIFAAAGLFSATKLIMWGQQPYYIALEIPEYLFGIFIAAGYLMGGVASHISHIIKLKASNLGIIARGWCIVILVSLCTAFAMNPLGIVCLMFGGTFMYGLIHPRVVGAINNRVDSSRRATVLSTASLIRELLFVPLSLMMGVITTDFGIDYGFYFVTVWLIAIGLIVMAWLRLTTRSSA